MITRTERLDQACACCCAREPYFAETYQAARALLNTAVFGADILRFAHDITCTPDGCNCGLPTCLHRVSLRLYTEPAQP